MLDLIDIHYHADMLGLATDNHAYGSIQQEPMEQAIWLWQFKQDGLDELGWMVWNGLLSVEESARAFDDAEIAHILIAEVAIG